MKAGKHGQLWSDAVRPRRAFTLVELLVVIGVIAFLAMLHVSARAGIRRHTKVAMCANNVRQLVHVLHMYANQNNGWLPSQSNWWGENWLWDLPVKVADTLLGYGLQTNTFYCPGTSIRFTEADNLKLWNFGSPAFRVTGYAFALRGSVMLFPTNENRTLEIQTVQAGSQTISIPNAQRVLVADATMSMSWQRNPDLRYNYDYTSIWGGYSKPHLSAHLEGRFPVGGNLGMVDGHVEWRKFDDMLPRTTGTFYNYPVPVFWW